MGFKLRREVRDVLPPGLLTAGERLLVLEVADDANDETREGWPGFDRLAAYADVSEAKVGEMFARVAKKWIELRMIAGFGKDGRPFYSRPGYNTHFRFPALEILEQLKDPQIGVAKVPQTRGAKAPQNRETRAPKSGGPSPQGSSPQKDSSVLSSPVGAGLDEADEPQAERDASDFQDSQTKDPDPYATQRGYLGRCGVTDETELNVLPALIEEMHEVTTPRAWWAIVHKRGDLPACIDEARATMAASRLFGDPSVSARPSDWCGVCELPNRWRYLNGDTSKPHRCPECHPQRARDQPRPSNGYQPYRDAARDYHSGEL